MTFNIGTRIVIGFLAILLLTTGLGAYQLGSMTSLRSSTEEILHANIAAVKLIGAIRSLQAEMRAKTEQAIGHKFLNDAGMAQRTSRAVQQQWELQRLETAAVTDELAALAAERAELSRVSENAEIWRAIVRECGQAQQKLAEMAVVISGVFEVLNANRLDELSSRMDVLDEVRAEFNANLTTLQSYADEMTVVAERGIEVRYDDVRRVFMIALGVTLIAALAAIWLLHRSIAPPLFELVSFVEKVGKGDLTQRIRSLGKDEMGRLARQFNEMVASLAESAKQMLAAAANVGGATAQLQASVSQQAASTNEQRTAIQEITTTLNEIAQSGSQISERAREVAASAEATSGSSRSGMEAVSETYRIMGAIGEQAEAVAENIIALTEKTRSVGDIVATVNDIAERSNLLALNAAIEASAAGEHGQSFAVVADEMKNLAGQAKEATVQVQSLLRDIQQGISTSVMQTEEAVKRTESGKVQSERMKEAIESLISNIDTSIQTFEQIVAATNQQQIGIEQVTQAIQDIRVSSGQVADSTRGLESATANLNALSHQLQKSVERYMVA